MFDPQLTEPSARSITITLIEQSLLIALIVLAAIGVLSLLAFAAGVIEFV